MPFRWRGWWNFGTGSLGDMGCHILDTPVWALDLLHPTSVEAVTTTPRYDASYPIAAMIRYEFPKHGSHPPMTLTWYDGGLAPFRPRMLEEARRMGSRDGGTIFVGSKGTLMCGLFGEGARLIPESAMKNVKRPPRTLQRTAGIYNEWLNACRGGEPATSNFDVSGPLTEIVLLGNVAMRYPGQRLDYDGENMRVTNVKEANQSSRRNYQNGWSL